jgi:hypothetical protein
MSSRDASWGQVLDVAINARLLGVHTAMVGTIHSYSEATQTAEVTLAVHLETADGEFEAVSPIADVPVAWPGAWAAGDSCLCVFCEESFAKWFATGSVEPPEVLRRHGLHAVCIPLVARGGQAVQFVALANLVKERLDAIQQAFDAHTHPVATTGSASAQTGTAAVVTSPIGPLASVAATKVKAR